MVLDSVAQGTLQSKPSSDSSEYSVGYRRDVASSGPSYIPARHKISTSHQSGDSSILSRNAYHEGLLLSLLHPGFPTHILEHSPEGFDWCETTISILSLAQSTTPGSSQSRTCTSPTHPPSPLQTRGTPPAGKSCEINARRAFFPEVVGSRKHLKSAMRLIPRFQPRHDYPRR